MNSKLRWGLALLGALLVKLMFLGYQGIPAGFITWAILAAILWGILGAVGHKATNHSSIPADFQPAVAHRNMQLDTKTNRLWVWPVKGRPRVLAREAIKGWSHEWVDRSNNFSFKRVNNTIALRTNDVQDPVVRVAFENFAIANEWQARLSAWINE